MLKITGHRPIKVSNIWMKHWVPEQKWWELKLKRWQNRSRSALSQVLNFSLQILESHGYKVSRRGYYFIRYIFKEGDSGNSMKDEGVFGESLLHTNVLPIVSRWKADVKFRGFIFSLAHS